MKQIARKSMSIALTLSMLLSAMPSAFALESGSDIQGHWAEQAMQSFVDRGYLSGDGSGAYAPDDVMTRAQFAAVMNRVIGAEEESGEISRYVDVPQSSWYYRELARALAAGFISGTSDTTMSPDAPVTRQQAFTMLSKYLKLDTTDLSALSAFSDRDDVADYAQGFVAAMVAAGYVQGFGDGTLLPEKELTRAEGVAALYKVQDVLAGAVSGVVYQDGVYTGTGAGYGGTITVQMTVENGKITKLEVTKHSETNSYLKRAQKLLDSVLNKQTTEGVDTISGATKSSNGLLTAIDACISQATGGADTSKTGSTGGGGGGRGDATKPEGDDFLGALTDGTYTGSARGYSGVVKVTVTVSGGKVAAINVDDHGDTTSYFNRSKTVIDQIIAKQSTDVDAVSGATYSSWGIINAVADALKGAVPPTEKTYQVTTWKEFTTALAKAADGDTIQLTSDITDAGDDYKNLTREDGSGYDTLVDAVSSATLGEARVSKAITVDGDGHSISAGDDMAYCFNISGSGVVMKNLTIDGASYGKKMGGGLYLAGGHGSTVTPSLELENVTIKNCVSYKSTMPGNGGGAIFCKGAVTLKAENCTFADNTVNVGLGGAILAQNANVTLKNCTFTGNTAPYGGAVAASGSAKLTVTECTFTGNDGVYGGDDLYIFDGKTPGKSGSFSDSAVTYALSGNTHSADGDSWTDYKVVLGRFLSEHEEVTDKDGNVTYKDYKGSGTPFITENGHELTFTGWERTELAQDNTVQYQYVLMNIPYDQFYAAELSGNNVKVDAVSSATKNKTRTGSLVAGSYHVDTDGTDITGITFPVVMSSTDFERFKADKTEITNQSSVSIEVTNRGQTSTTTYRGKDALFEQDSYAYYKLDQVPTYYKLAAVAADGTVSFGKVQGVSTALSGVKASLQTESSYGDYQINLMDDSDTISSNATVYAVILSTKEGSSYGLRHLENVWLGTELAICTGFTAAVHNCPTSSAHYEAIMGQTITQITYIMDTGIYTMDTELYIPVKFSNTLSVANAVAESGSAAVTMTGFPQDFQAQYTVTNAAGDAVTAISCDGSALTWSGALRPGAYTLTVTDASGAYAAVSTEFTLSTSTPAAAYDAAITGLKAADGTSAGDFAAYLAAITSVSVDGTAYAATGKRATVIVQDNGRLDLTAVPFQTEAKDEQGYAVTVTASGYPELSFTVKLADTVYAYAALTYAEYWQNEDVSVSGDDLTASGAEKDSNNETDTGAFDAVTRATQVHGRHRGSFQQTVVVYAEDGTTFPVSYWTDSNTAVLTDGSTMTWSKSTITWKGQEYAFDHYEMDGIKYVPVAVARTDFAAFCKAYTVTRNGEVLMGGYSENQLSAYTDLVANVTADTNGLKQAALNNGVWSFGPRQTGTDSGILNQALAVVDDENITKTVKNTSKYGDFVRLDLTGTAYGALGGKMQSVVWNYYGDGDTVLASYGTKFAADNWMHKSNGIQLGLTESLRCQLPAGTTGAGRWTVTVYALGCQDYTVEFTVTADDLHGQSSPMTPAQRTQLEALKTQAAELLNSETGKAGLESGAANWNTLNDHFNEVSQLLNSADASYGMAAELLDELPDLIAGVSGTGSL